MSHQWLHLNLGSPQLSQIVAAWTQILIGGWEGGHLLNGFAHHCGRQDNYGDKFPFLQFCLCLTLGIQHHGDSQSKIPRRKFSPAFSLNYSKEYPPPNSLPYSHFKVYCPSIPEPWISKDSTGKAFNGSKNKIIEKDAPIHKKVSQGMAWWNDKSDGSFLQVSYALLHCKAMTGDNLAPHHTHTHTHTHTQKEYFYSCFKLCLEH